MGFEPAAYSYVPWCTSMKLDCCSSAVHQGKISESPDQTQATTRLSSAEPTPYDAHRIYAGSLWMATILPEAQNKAGNKDLALQLGACTKATNLKAVVSQCTGLLRSRLIRGFIWSMRQTSPGPPQPETCSPVHRLGVCKDAVNLNAVVIGCAGRL